MSKQDISDIAYNIPAYLFVGALFYFVGWTAFWAFALIALTLVIYLFKDTSPRPVKTPANVDKIFNSPAHKIYWYNRYSHVQKHSLIAGKKP